jgi:hypothetical protein
VPSVDAHLAIGDGNACRIAHQADGFDVIARIVNRRNGMACRQCNQPLTLAGEEWTAADQQRLRPLGLSARTRHRVRVRLRHSPLRFVARAHDPPLPLPATRSQTLDPPERRS